MLPLALTLVSSATVRIDTNTTSVPNLGWISVSWAGLTAKEAADAFIGVYAAGVDVSPIAPLPYPAAAPWTATNAIKYLPFDVNNLTGTGTWDFELINMYTSVVFHLFVGGIAAPKRVASSAVVSFEAPAAPLRGHLAPTGVPQEMRCTWNSPLGDDDAPTVRWGTSAGGPYTQSAAATIASYTRADMCGPPANSDFGWFEGGNFPSAVMTNLSPGATYYYVYGGATSDTWSAEASFVALSGPAPSAPLNLLLWADHGMTVRER